MKKIISVFLFLFLIMTIGLIAANVVISTATTTELPPYEIFETEYLMNILNINGTIYNGKEDIYEKARTTDFFHREVHELNSSNVLFSGLNVVSVKLLNNDINLSTHPEHFYSVVLMDLLANEELKYFTDTSLETTVTADAFEAVQNLYEGIGDAALESLDATTREKFENVDISKLDASQKNKFLSEWEAANDFCYKYEQTMDNLEFLSLILDYGDSILDAANKLSSLYAVADYNDKMLAILDDMKARTTNNNLKIAIRDIREIYDEMNSPSEVQKCFSKADGMATVYAIERIAEETLRYIVDAVLSSVLGVPYIVWDVGVSLVDTMFNMGEKATIYMTIDAATLIEDEIRALMSVYRGNFILNKSHDNAEKCRNAFRLLLANQYYATNLVQELGWIIAGNGSFWGSIKVAFGCDDYDTFVHLCNAERNVIKYQFFDYISDAQILYEVKYNIEFNEDYYSDRVKLESIDFKHKNYTLFMNESFSNPAIPTPSNGFGGCPFYESDNENIATVDPLGHIRAVSPGTVKIRAESVGGDCTDVCTITVLPFEAVKENGTYTINKYVGNSMTVNIPNDVNGVKVCSVDSHTFANTSVTNVTIPDNVTSTGDYYGILYCESLEKIDVSSNNTTYSSVDGVLFNKDQTTLIQYPQSKKDMLYRTPDGVTHIGDYAFNSCENLIQIEMANSVEIIGSAAFEDCTNLSVVNIPDNLNTIEWFAFDGCENIRTLRIGKNLLNDSSPWYFLNTITEVVITDSLECIDYNNTNFLYGLEYFENLERIIVEEDNKWYSNDEYGVLYSKDMSYMMYFPVNSPLTSYSVKDGTKYISGGAFVSNPNNLKVITLPNSIVEICDDAFIGFENLTSINIPDNVIRVGDRAFQYCCNLTSITIGNGVESIGVEAFCFCDSLTSVTIGDGVISIGDLAFEGCDSLTSVYYTGDIAGWCSISFVYDSNPMCYADKLYINGELIEGDLIIPDNATTIGEGAFESCDSLTSVMIPDSVTSIGDSAFESCTGLTSVTIGDSVTTIGNSAFYTCTNLTSVKIGNGVTSIEGYAFGDCDSLGSVVIPDSVTSIGYAAFRSCNSLTSIVIPDSVTSIGYDAFNGCTGLTSITIPDSVTNINSWTFASCDSLTNITIPDSVTSIDHSAFYSCDNLTSITIPDSITSIDTHVFYGCDSLTDIYYWGSEEQWNKISIGSNNESLTKAIVWFSYSGVCGDNLIWRLNPKTGIFKVKGTGVMTNYSSTSVAPWDEYRDEIQSIIICDGVTTIGNNTFYGCPNLLSVMIPDGITKIGDTTFRDCTSLTEITLPNTVDSIGIDAFAGCYNLVILCNSNSVAHNYAVENSLTYKLLDVVVIGENANINVDNITKTINGFVGEIEELKALLSVSDSFTIVYENLYRIATGSEISIVNSEGVVVETYSFVVFGDTNGDSWYDGMDAVLVSCLANGMLTKDDVSEAVYMAADCNHDGVIDQLDVDLLNQAGTLLANVDQSKPAEVLLETSAEYVEYISLIDQSPEIDVEDETDAPEADAETTPEQNAKVDIFEMIMNFIRFIIEMILSRIPVPYK